LATTTKPWSSTAPPAEFRPYVDASSTLTEFSWRAVILGAIFGALFGAVSVYVGLRAGLTVSASIPIPVSATDSRTYAPGSCGGCRRA